MPSRGSATTVDTGTISVVRARFVDAVEVEAGWRRDRTGAFPESEVILDLRLEYSGRIAKSAVQTSSGSPGAENRNRLREQD